MQFSYIFLQAVVLSQNKFKFLSFLLFSTWANLKHIWRYEMQRNFNNCGIDMVLSVFHSNCIVLSVFVGINKYKTHPVNERQKQQIKRIMP